MDYNYRETEKGTIQQLVLRASTFEEERCLLGIKELFEVGGELKIYRKGKSPVTVAVNIIDPNSSSEPE